MNFLKKGPELKMPDKMPKPAVPGFVADIYHELRSRHLLPLVAVLVVAIVAVPIALGESAETMEPLPEGGAGVSASNETQVVATKSSPGLRDFRERLADLEAKDPFVAPGGSGNRGSGVGEAGTAEGGSETDAPTSPEGGVPYDPSGGTTTRTRTYYSWTVDVRVVPVSANGKPAKEQPSVRRNQPELTMFPGRQTPAVVFIGPSSDEQKALMLVSSNVKGMFGDAICVLGGETCEMIALEKGVPQTFVYGGNERVFRLELIDVQLTESDKLNKAPLGEPKEPGSSAGGE